MKTITMDYGTYIQELKDAKESGFYLLPELEKKLNAFLATIDGYGDRSSYEQKRYELFDLIERVKSVKHISERI